MNIEVEELCLALTMLVQLNKDVVTKSQALMTKDISALDSEFSDYAESSLLSVRDQIQQLAETTNNTLTALNGVAALMKSEKVKGRGQWREIAKSESNLRVSISAIRSLRETHDLSLAEARYVIDRFQQGHFQ